MPILRPLQAGLAVLTVAAGVMLAGTPSSPAMATVLADPDTTPPSVSGPPIVTNFHPTTLSARWSPATDDVGVTGYQVLLTPGPGAGAPRTVDLGPVLFYMFTGLTPGGSYGLSLRARDAAGNWSPEVAQPVITVLPMVRDTVAPTPPGAPVVSGLTHTGFTLTWAASTDSVGVLRYEVFVGSLVGTTEPGNTTFTVTGLQPNNLYQARVHAVDGAGNRSVSSPTPVVTPSVGPGCLATFQILTAWNAVAQIVVRNTGPTTIGNWTVRWVWPYGTVITSVSPAVLDSNVPNVSVRGVPGYNATLAPGQTATFTITFTGLGTPSIPTVSCTPS